MRRGSSPIRVWMRRLLPAGELLSGDCGRDFGSGVVEASVKAVLSSPEDLSSEVGDGVGSAKEAKILPNM